ncbi:hypothetical protein [Accumulibacter sp.]|uniref:hypothetical protein n=1 Tax=Accumulibacter sp. TaxID=2053492 RepID=UPI0026219ECF|nr:hypothetical protein [Accumulibacter sp.]
MFSQTSCINPRARFLSGRRRTIELAVAASAIAASLVATPVAATTLFQENFEVYAVGSTVTGQGGWVPDYVNSTLNVGNGTFLPTKVLNGLAPTNGGQNFSTRPLGLGLDPNLITTLSFDAYATSGGAHNALIGLAETTILNFAESGPYWQLDLSGPGGRGWRFYAGNLNGTPGDFIHLVGGYNTPVKMSIVIDGVANGVYGVYDFGGGPLQTPHYAVTDAQIATLNEVGVEFDFRGTLGPELDNPRVFDNVSAVVPEPGSALLVAAPLGLLGFNRRRS